MKSSTRSSVKTSIIQMLQVFELTLCSFFTNIYKIPVPKLQFYEVASLALNEYLTFHGLVSLTFSSSLRSLFDENFFRRNAEKSNFSSSLLSREDLG